MEKLYEYCVEPRLLEIGAWARDGMSEKAIAKKLKISYASFRNYKKDHPALAGILAENKKITDIKVENALLQRALGYKYTETTEETGIDFKTGKPVAKTKIVSKELPPDVNAQQFWLVNRKRNTWNDKKKVEVSVDTKKLSVDILANEFTEFENSQKDPK